MKTNSHDELENHNLVMFPASKNFKINLSAMEVGQDPLHDLMNEYAHIKDEDLPDHLDDRFELEDELDGDVFHSLEAFMTRNLRGESQSPDDKLIKMINDRIQAIKDAKERIKFYLEEIEMFLPSRRK
ncbi:MAG: hypothetical protein PHY93_14505 [Bacteriovorax sp.]|nr:hypothetical protein [Bacteriovorax sp.]